MYSANTKKDAGNDHEPLPKMISHKYAVTARVKLLNADLQTEIPGEKVENDHVQAQQSANNDDQVRRLSRTARQPARFVPGAKDRRLIMSW